MKELKIAVLGLGTMGQGMARRILGGGFPLTVYNRNAQRAAALAKDGVRIASTPGEAAAGADIVISMLADDDACRGVWLGDFGAILGVRKGAILVESSTVSLGWIRELQTAAKKAGCQLLDAPVTGSKVAAAAGELQILVGGDAEALEIARPVLTVMSKTIVHLGPAGSGAMIKLINNFLCGVQLASLAEAVAMIQRSGLDKKRAMDVLSGGAPGSPMVKAISARIAANDFSPNFSLKLMAKDLRYAAAEGDALSVKIRTAAAALEVLKIAIGAGYGDQDIAAAVKAF